MPEPSPSRIDALLERCIGALEADGDEGAVDAILAEHPDEAPEVRQLLANLAGIGLLHAPRTDAHVPERLGEFELVRQIGCGGMGAVFLARQPSLQREVALKLVRPEHVLFGGARERFRREILAIGRLQHPGIVPILTGGESGGVPFYAMELVHGASLGELLDQLTGRRSAELDGAALREALEQAMRDKADDVVVENDAFRGSWVQACCRIVRAVAEAIQHAHDRGVLHRDIKPSNVLVTHAGDARVIDFGLASAEGEHRITRSGASFGSVPYMAPEQVRGDTARIDERTDVYGLGVTLYELLTLELPFGDGPATRERIVRGECEPPARKNPRVHPDLDAVCGMAMDVDPARRYASAADLAADLDAFLGQRSVRARRPSTWLRARRWAARHPMRTAAGLLAFALLVPGPLLFAWQQSAAAAEIRVALDEAERNLDHALRAVDQMLLRTANARLADVPRTVELRKQLLQDAVDFHEQLVAAANRAGDSQRTREARARSLWRLGSLRADLGELDEGIALMTRARDDLEALRPTSPRAIDLSLELARCCTRLGSAHGHAGESDAAVLALRRSIELFDGAARERNDGRAREGALEAGLHLAAALGQMRRFDEAFAALDDLDAHLDPGPELPGVARADRIRLWARVADQRGILFALDGRSSESLASFEEALERYDQLVAGVDDGALLGDRTHAGLLFRLGLMLHQRREWGAAADHLRRALAAHEHLVEREPEVPTWRSRLATLLATRAANNRMLGRPTAALEDHDRAIETLRQVVAQAPRDIQNTGTLAIAFADRAACHQGLGDAERALADYSEAERLLRTCLEARPGERGFTSNLIAVMGNHASAMRDNGDVAGAREVLAEACSLARGLTAPEDRRLLVELLDEASSCAHLDGDDAAAMALDRECLEQAQAYFAAAPDDPLRQNTWTLAQFNHGAFLLRGGDAPAAIAAWEASLPIAREASGGSARGRRLLGLVLLQLCWTHRDLGRGDLAREWFAAAMRETGIRREELGGHAVLVELFDDAAFADLVPGEGR